MFCPRSVRSILRVASIGMLSIFAAFLIASILRQQYETWQDHKSFPQLGQSFDIGGRKLNLFCSGTGSPIVLFDSGHSLPGLEWAEIQAGVSHSVQACWYDRAGYGWSDPGPFPRRSNDIAEDLHRLVIAANLHPPFVLVGHLFGAFNVRAYQQLYPSEVSGIALIDPSSEASVRDNPTIPPNRHIEALRPFVIRIATTFAELGINRWRQKPPPLAPSGFPAHAWNAIAMLNRQPKTTAARIQETPLRFSAAQMHGPLTPDDLPLLVLSPNLIADGGKADLEKLQLQAALANMSKNGRQIVLPLVANRIPYENSTHMVPYESPAETIAAIENLVQESHSYSARK